MDTGWLHSLQERFLSQLCWVLKMNWPELSLKDIEAVFIRALNQRFPDREKTVFVSELIRIIRDDDPKSPELMCGMCKCPFFQLPASPSYPWAKCMLPGEENGCWYVFEPVERWLRSYSEGKDGKTYLTIAPERSRNCVAVRPLITTKEGGD